METIGKVIKSFKSALAQIYPENEIQAINELAFEHFLNLSKTDLVTKNEMVLNEKDSNKLKEVLARLKKHEPIQHIIGKCIFYDCSLTLNNNVLIPRQETEELVDLIISESKTIINPKILDIGTGSGCIAIALAKHLESANVYACDISQAALDVANQNAEENQVHIHFSQKNILLSSSDEENQEFDIIVSNPPYVLKSEKEKMKKNVLDFEPWLALFVDDDDPLLFYKAIVNYANQNLKPQGSLYFETNEAFGDQVASLMEKSGYVNVKVLKDINSKDRIVFAKKLIG